MTNSIETNRDTPDGRLIVSHPKSGRTWLHFALTEAGITARFTHAGASKNRMKMGSPFRGIRASLRDQPLVFLHRNPIDTAVSYYYQIHRRILRRWSARWFRLWVPLFLRRAFPPRDIGAFVLHPHYGVEKIRAYNRTWLDHLKNRDDCLIITYEAMRADPATGFQKILDFRGITGTTGVTMADLSTFEKMRAFEQARTGTTVLKAARPGDPSSTKVRKGKVRGYLEELSPETVEHCHTIAKRYGFLRQT